MSVFAQKALMALNICGCFFSQARAFTSRLMARTETSIAAVAKKAVSFILTPSWWFVLERGVMNMEILY